MIKTMTRRGLTALELLLAISITCLITLGIASMLAAVAQGTEYDKFQRETIVRSQALNVRLGSYVTPSLCILDNTNESLVLWLNDNREGETVHATELRWIDYNAATDTVRLHLVDFPEEWSQSERDENDAELEKTTDWWTVLSDYQTLGYILKNRLSGEVETFLVERNLKSEQGVRVVTFTITYSDQTGAQTVVLEAGVREYKEPVS